MTERSAGRQYEGDEVHPPMVDGALAEAWGQMAAAALAPPVTPPGPPFDHVLGTVTGPMVTVDPGDDGSE